MKQKTKGNDFKRWKVLEQTKTSGHVNNIINKFNPLLVKWVSTEIF